MTFRVMGQATTTMSQLQKQMDVIGHNLANSQTNGYKSRQTEFQSLLFQQIDHMTHPEGARGRMTPDGIRVGTGARLGATNSNLSMGAIQETGRVLDTVLLNEHHYYQIQVEENGQPQTYYTRDGAFYLSPINDGEMVALVTKDGHPVYGVNGPIRFSTDLDSLHINERGNIVATRNNEEEIVGTLAIAEIVRPRLLEAVGDNSFRLPDVAALGYNENDIVRAPVEENLVKNQALEVSNVSIQDEMTQLIVAQRAYQFNARSLSMADQMQGLINQMR